MDMDKAMVNMLLGEMYDLQSEIGTLRILMEEKKVFTKEEYKKKEALVKKEAYKQLRKARKARR